MKSRLIGKDTNAGKDGVQKERKVSDDEMAEWHYQCNGHEFGQTSGNGKGLGGLACCSPWGRKESDMTGQLNSNDNNSDTENPGQGLSHTFSSAWAVNGFQTLDPSISA